jgi:LysR family positive regulator for ilvC
MDTDDYQAFDELLRQGHFGRAAKRLGASPSALSRRIQALEETLGVSLVERGHKTLTLTGAGATFLRFARDELLREEALRLELAAHAGAPEGELRLACTVTACYSILPQLIAECRRRFPAVSLKVLTQDAAQSLAALLSGDIDLAVIPSEDDTEGELAFHALGRAELVFIGPPKSVETDLGPLFFDALTERPARPIDQRRLHQLLANVPFVAQLAGLERKRLDQWRKERALESPIAAEVRGNEGIIAMVALGTGIGLVPDLVLDKSPAEVTRLLALPAPPGYDVSLCAKRKTLKRPAAAAFWGIATGKP